eukprot:18416-Heterococcus_DN1.PRE.3
MKQHNVVYLLTVLKWAYTETEFAALCRNQLINQGKRAPDRHPPLGMLSVDKNDGGYSRL